MTATQDDTIAELRRSVAELRRERDAALSEKAALAEELAARDSEFRERIEQQSATSDVLKVMSASPGDPQPVFDLITTRARELCGSVASMLFEYDGELLHMRTWGGYDPAAAENYLRQFPMRPDRSTAVGRAVLEQRIVHIRDVAADPEIGVMVRTMGVGSTIVIPLQRDGQSLGVIAIGLLTSGGFSDSQIELLRAFGEQAVIAITSAETHRALQARTADLQESLNYQTATSDVLKVISRSTFELQPILDALVETAARLCAADSAQIATREGDACRNVASFMLTPEYDALAQGRLVPIERGHVAGRTMLEQRIIHIADVAVDPEYTLTEVITVGGYRTLLGVPLWRAGEVIGTINLGRQRVEPFTDRQIELVSTFADQAVIAIENTRLLGELREALEQQTATAEVLQVINASPGNVAPVFDAMLKKAIHLCRASAGIFWTHGGGQFRAAAISAMPPAFVEFLRTPLTPGPTTALARTVQQRRMMHRLGDMREGDAYRSRDPFAVATVELGGFRSIVAMPLVKDGELLGSLSLYRRKVEAFTDKEVGSLPSFAAQAVIAMENARLLGELRQRQEELRATFENMGDGVAMFDDTPRLVAWNHKFQDILDLPDGALSDRLTFAEYIRYLTECDEFGAGADPEEQIRRLTENTDQYRAFERVRPDGRVIEVRHNPVPGGGFVLIYADITERKRNEGELRAARDAAEEASRTIEAAYRDLKAAQANLIQAEKMASLGQLTAGIAHEIKNPLNFVNNFAELSVDLLDELNEAVANNRPAEVEELTGTLKGNLGKIAEHGRRADGIVRGMLEHSRGSSGEQRSVDLNVLVDEALNLAYHGARAQDQSFNVVIERELGEGISPITLAPQDVARVLLNLLSNGFYAARERQRMETISGFEPSVEVSTRELGDAVEILVRDNGIGIPAEIKDRLFQPFFTTKPPGEGTGLGLSMSYDIITQQHGGSITVDSNVGEYSEFIVRLPRIP